MHAIYPFLIDLKGTPARSIPQRYVKMFWADDYLAQILGNGQIPNDAAGWTGDAEAAWEALSPSERQNHVDRYLRRYQMSNHVPMAAEDFERYISEYGDENNWYQPMALISPAGEPLLLAPIDDWRGRHQLYYELLIPPPDVRWEKALAFAEQCTDSEIQRQEILRVMAPQFLEDYVYEPTYAPYLESAVYGKFSTLLGRPEVYRGYDLRAEPLPHLTDYHGILFVDIHT